MSIVTVPAESLCVIYALHLGDQRYRYVGLTRLGIDTRLRKHRNIARRGVDKSPVYRWMRKHGLDAIRADVLEVVSTPEGLDEREIHWIAKLKVDGYDLLNCTAGGRGMRVISEEVRIKMGPRRGSRLSPEHLAKISGENHHFFGKKHTAETRAKMSANSGPRRPEVAAKIRAAKLGVPRPPDVVERMRATKASRPTEPNNHIRWHVSRDQWAENCEFCLFEVA